MKIIIYIIAFIFPYSSHASAAVEEQRYGGFQFSLLTYDEDGHEADPAVLVARYGQFINDWFAIEGRIGLGVADDTLEVGSFGIDVEVEHIIGLYGVFHAASNSNTSLYGIIGYTSIDLEGSALGLTFSDDSSGFSYGFGIDTGSFNIEYMLNLEDNYYDVTTISIGYISRF